MDAPIKGAEHLSGQTLGRSRLHLFGLLGDGQGHLSSRSLAIDQEWTV
jgi:hypothetical protein